METNLRKAKQHFDTLANPVNVTFDDGRFFCRCFPWLHFVEARRDYSEPDTVRVEIGEWFVVITGHNLAALFAAIEEHALFRVRAQPELLKSREREMDSFATEIRFLKISPGMADDGAKTHP